MTPEAQKLLEALKSRRDGHQRQALPVVVESYYHAFPERRERADQRDHPRLLLVELETSGEITLPRGKTGWEGGPRQALPLWFQWPEKPSDSPKFNHRAFPWVAELRFIASLPGLRDPDVARRIHEFLKSGGQDRPLIPMKERSWELFGDEKALDSIKRGPLFQPGGLTLEHLRCYEVPASLTCRPGPDHSQGPWLIVENEATFDTFARWNKESGHHRGVILGNGYAIYRATRFILDVLDSRGADYFGDLTAQVAKSRINSTPNTAKPAEPG